MSGIPVAVMHTDRTPLVVDRLENFLAEKGCILNQSVFGAYNAKFLIGEVLCQLGHISSLELNEAGFDHNIGLESKVDPILATSHLEDGGATGAVEAGQGSVVVAGLAGHIGKGHGAAKQGSAGASQLRSDCGADDRRACLVDEAGQLKDLVVSASEDYKPGFVVD